MAQVSAQLHSLRISPRKVRLVTDLIKGLEAGEATLQLQHFVKRASSPIEKLVQSAIANARHNAKVPAGEALFIKDIRVDEGRVLKRTMPRARGRANVIKKRSSRVVLVLETRAITGKNKK